MKIASQREAFAQSPGTSGDVLVEAGWLRDHLTDPRVRVVEVDVSPANYRDWHIDGAVLWNVYAELKDADYRLADVAALERLVARAGIDPDSTVVFYGYAPALGLWLMKLYGHRDVRILNCSRDTWRGAGYPWSTAETEPSPGSLRLDGEDAGIRADWTAVREAIGRPGTTLVDVRSAAEYQGERFWPSGGMEPGGCGLGASTILLATEYPNSRFAGSDYHDKSIEIARKRAADAGVADRIGFEVAPASGFSGTGYDLAATFDCLHDMGDPLAAARHVRQALNPDGTWLLVEPYAADEVSGNLNPVGRIYYNASTQLCVPNALSQPGGYALGAQAGEAAIRQLTADAGFTRFRRAAETPFNLVFEVRP